MAETPKLPKSLTVEEAITLLDRVRAANPSDYLKAVNTVVRDAMPNLLKRFVDLSGQFEEVCTKMDTIAVALAQVVQGQQAGGAASEEEGGQEAPDEAPPVAPPVRSAPPAAKRTRAKAASPASGGGEVDLEALAAAAEKPQAPGAKPEAEAKAPEKKWTAAPGRLVPAKLPEGVDLPNGE